ncbi:uncharacterized protein PHALS_06697 [Plasmopara halstedii]|uniref:Uncharacterized protein n=1 Tax=Plasmopara halstedii TaxID=4781 RepID=A0A0P1B5F8_PLAHL|nr:uncharacterized protein PHALS_06697 [Plasmopara halstedii]CEG48902.1 hypothetical protein PHALS_06697 [Plasmopara halstedii]|eukprot:XP_024585271.1 hypothetical protein PHALS_06697 [Plasmopara halstedii]
MSADNPHQKSAPNSVPAITAQVPTSSVATASHLNKQDDMRISDVPYAAAQPTPAALMKTEPIKVSSTLPPIAAAQPLASFNQNQFHSLDGSSDSSSPHIYQSGLNNTNTNHVVMVTSVDPVGSAGDTETDSRHFTYLHKCQLMASCLLVFYAATFLFLQPFLLGALGLLTSILGFCGSRAPIDATRFKWLCYYLWANYVMLILNMWLLIVTLVFSGGVFSSDSWDYSTSTGLYVGLLVAVNTLMHLRCLRSVQLLVAELKNAGIDRPAPVVMLATANPTLAV